MKTSLSRAVTAALLLCGARHAAPSSEKGSDHEPERTEQMNAKYPGIPTVIHGNGAVAQVMGHVCGGVIGYPITPSTEIAEIYEAFRSAGGCNVWGKHPFFFEPEGEHSAQSGALGAALTGGKFVSNASSSQGILYALEFALRDGWQESRRLRAAGRRARRIEAFAQRDGRP